MWPMGFNYSLADYHLKPKMPFWWIRASQQPILFAGENLPDGTVRLHAINDTLQDVNGLCTLVKVAPDGTESCLWCKDFRIPANGRCVFQNSQALENGLYLLDWGFGSNHFLVGEPPFPRDDWRVYRKVLEKRYRP